jgi:hypothetical protein
MLLSFLTHVQVTEILRFGLSNIDPRRVRWLNHLYSKIVIIEPPAKDASMNHTELSTSYSQIQDPYASQADNQFT